LIKDFNWCGHSGYLINKKKKLGINHLDGRPCNHWSYGYLASEWHANHHRYPSAARTGVITKELDIVYWVLRLFKKIGIVKRLNPIL